MVKSPKGNQLKPPIDL